MTQDRLNGTPFAIIPIWVLREGSLSDRAVRLYGVLYGYVGEKEVAWPLQSTLADDMQCSLTSVKNALRELVDLGAVIRTPRYRENTNEIIGCWYEIVVKNPKGVGSPLPNPRQPVAYPLGSPLPTYIDTLELDTSKDSCTKKSHDYPDDFEVWWKAYPKSVAKKKTLGCWNATLRDRGGTVESIMLATTLYVQKLKKEGTEKQYTLNSDTFLGPNERWREHLPESFSPETLAQARAWEVFDNVSRETIDATEPPFPRPTDGNGKLLDSSGRTYYIDPMDFKRRYTDDE